MMPAVHVRWSLVAGLPCDEIDLSPEERDMHAHIRDQRRAGEWLAGRILVKRWFAERLESGVRPTDITVVSTDGFGRSVAPRAFWRGRMLPERFSIAHAAGIVLVTLASRPDVRVGADVVAAIPSAPTTGVLTMWTEDYSRTGGGFTDIPSVPVTHLNLAGTPQSPAYSIADGTPLRAATGDLVPVLGPATGTVLDPNTFNPIKPGKGPAQLPILDDAAAWFVGKILDRFSLGDHVGHLLQPLDGDPPDALEQWVSFGDVRSLEPGHEA